MLPVIDTPRTPAVRALEAGLREKIVGEVRFDIKSRLLYSTDASLYQILPLGVVLPRNAEDVETVMKLAGEAGVPVLPRGGGTALAGQTVAEAVIIDFSKYMNKVLELDPEKRIARVQPGLRLDRLNRAAAPHGLQFGPDPATFRQCALGGMIGNNSCGSRSLVYGKTGDHVHSLRCFLPDSTCVDLRPVDRKLIPTLPGREGELARQVLSILEPERERILSRYPRVPRRVSGYNFDAILEEEKLNLAKLIVGSEGTLATVVEAELGLVPVPNARSLVLLSFRERWTSMDAIPAILPESGLSALEIVDSRVLNGARELFEFRATASLIPSDALGVLFCEFSGDSPAEVAALAHDFAARAPRLPGTPTPRVFLVPAEQTAAWSLRQLATGLLYRTTASRDIRPQEFVEDTGIAPEKLGAYTRRFEEIVHRNGTTLGFFGHAGQGCLHIRVDLNLKRGEDVHRMRAIARDVAELVVEFGGSLSGEHGDGLSRSEFLPLMFGPEIMQLHREVKAVFDPENRANPGKIVETPPMTDNLRFGEEYRATSPETFFDYSEDGGWDKAVEKCSGMAVCRKLDVGTMCPSFMVTQEEESSTRGRANSLREAMRGNLPGMKSEETLEALDLCLECKACKTECPVGVDMARYKSEFLAQHYKATGKTPAPALFFGKIRDFARIGSLAPGLANFGSRIAAPVLKRLAHVDPRRSLPEVASTTFRREWGKTAGARAGSPSGEKALKGRVILLDDTFHNYFEPRPLSAAARVIGRAGYSVELPERQVCCGRSLISKGLLPEAKETLRDLVEVLAPAAEAGIPIVGVEPSCILTLRDELPDLVSGPRAKAIASQTFTFEEFLAGPAEYQPGRLERNAVVHGHCHQKALVGMEPTRKLLSRVEGLEYRILDSGCCGMAGSFGYEEGHYEVSRAAGERVLFPAVRAAEDLVVAPGFSCRSQIKDFCDGRRAIHTAELLDLAEQAK
ncbi:MAG: FAD-binding oxidoreductase [Gemmatimonadota bacterium]|jgi:FAD/FMN-containing dehydrogenase/Fe-S oxidoreductase|nr:FAD-binding oxidoreductase [Gemmatimonadota bacterium]